MMSKVNVLQVEDAKFSHKFSRWSHWVDVAVFDYSHQVYLLQMRISRGNKKDFRTINCNQRCSDYVQASSQRVGDLMPMQRGVDDE